MEGTMEDRYNGHYDDEKKAHGAYIVRNSIVNNMVHNISLTGELGTNWNRVPIIENNRIEKARVGIHLRSAAQAYVRNNILKWHRNSHIESNNESFPVIRYNTMCQGENSSIIVSESNAVLEANNIYSLSDDNIPTFQFEGPGSLILTMNTIFGKNLMEIVGASRRNFETDEVVELNGTKVLLKNNSFYVNNESKKELFHTSGNIDVEQSGNTFTRCSVPSKKSIASIEKVIEKAEVKKRTNKYAMFGLVASAAVVTFAVVVMVKKIIHQRK
eukprot:g539.t1